MNKNRLIRFLAGTIGHEPEPVVGGVRFRHQPDLGELAYLCTIYEPLGEGLAERWFAQFPIPETPYRAFLTGVANGLRLASLSLFGVVERIDRSVGSGAGQPIGLDYGNSFDRPLGLHDGDSVIGALTGWSSKGVYVMDTKGAVRLVHSTDGDDIADRWPSLDAMLQSEAVRIADQHDSAGRLVTSWSSLMHPNGQHWETSAKPQSTRH